MKITINRHSGYCFGVEYAIQIAEDELKKNKSLYCLGDIVHNDMEKTDYAVPRAYRSVYSGLFSCALLLTNVITTHLPHRGQPVMSLATRL